MGEALRQRVQNTGGVDEAQGDRVAELGRVRAEEQERGHMGTDCLSGSL